MVRISGYLRLVRSSVGTYGVSTKRPLPRTNVSMCMIGVPFGRLVVARPLDRADFVEVLERDPGERQRGGGDLVHDLRAVGVAHRVAQRGGGLAGDLPLLLPHLDAVTGRRR